MTRIRAVLFDIDGTLLDSNDAHAHAWLDALRGHGRSVPLDRVRSRIGMGGDRLLLEIGIDPESIEGRSIDERRAAVLKAHYLLDVGPFPSARVLVDRLRSRGLLCAAVTSSTSEDAADLLRAAAVADLMHAVITADDVDRSKPDPDLVTMALERLGVSASEAAMIGDTPYDVDAAAQAGVSAIAFRCGGWDDASLAGAVAIYDDPSDLSAQLDRSLLVRGVEADAPHGTLGKQRGRRSAMRGA
jgi:HAD superfamily hydrolase (TIGR01509 family)